MEGKELNIKSSTIEKGLDLAKDFLGKLISPTVEEVGLLLSENIKYLRFKNQIKILLKSKTYLESKGISLKEIPIKILVPLLENASLEDDETFQEKWANMLSNMVDSRKNLQNHIFPAILSQISKEEFLELQNLAYREVDFKNLKINSQMTEKEKQTLPFSKKWNPFEKDVNEIEQNGFHLELKGYEKSNLLRLGLIRQLPPKINIKEFKTGSANKFYQHEQWHQLDAEYIPEEFGYRITELGVMFMEICTVEN
ncbi:MAG: Abi-alpha family protein [Bacteroidota bacterium]|jgi:hypothetical protein|nr:DUF4393 domain-containing protein [Cytophagales bacterium]MCE2957022.1 DUF4393 domain-containing protein [Flammeovirgaceae bacterium]MCZ8068897.1 Abi-alpha family protein [Cytophagales bacterium]